MAVKPSIVSALLRLLLLLAFSALVFSVTADALEPGQKGNDTTPAGLLP